MEYAAKQASDNNGKYLEGMTKLSKEPTAPPNAAQLMQQAHDVKTKTESLISYLHALKAELVTKAGEGFDEHGLVNNKDGSNNSMNLMMNQKKGYELEKAT